MSGWRPSLLIAWREVLRAKGRSALVLLMIMLPVLAVTAAAVVLATSDVSTAEGLDGKLGAADAWVEAGRAGKVLQAPDPGTGSGVAYVDPDPAPGVATESEITAAVRGARLVRVDQAQGRVVVDDDSAPQAMFLEVDLSDDLVGGMVRLDEGRLPRTREEVLANASLGVPIGDRVEVDGRALTVVGLGEHWQFRSMPFLAGPAGSLIGASDLPDAHYLLGGGDVTWDDVMALNDLGVVAWSRHVILDPPPASQVPFFQHGLGGGSERGSDVYAIAGLIVAMALLEIVLLAGPAFAVGARRQSRTLALLAASGGTPRQARRTIIASGIVLGLLAAVGGVVLGILAGRALVPVAQRVSDSWFGPFEVPWLWVLGIAFFGLASAVLAAVVPAWIASRQDVVAVLAGRRGDRPPTMRSPLAGVLLLAAGIAGSAVGSQATDTSGAVLIAGSAIVAVLGMILVVPLVVSLVARAASRLPLALRYAARDAARHRTRTVPAVAAVAATVAGVVALGIANTSDAAQARETYRPILTSGSAFVQAWEASADEWTGIERVLTEQVPDGEVEVVNAYAMDETSTVDAEFVVPGFGPDEVLQQSYQSFGPSSVLVATHLPEAMTGLDADARAKADRALAAGGVVLFADRDVADQQVRVIVRKHDNRSSEEAGVWRMSGLDATFVNVGLDAALGAAVVSPEVADAIGAPYSPDSIVVTGADISKDREKAIDAALGSVSPNAGFYVERGYQGTDSTVILLLVLGGLGGVLMLGGTLTATFLALSDARPDLATLSAVGASPRKRRAVAAAYALLVGGVGAVLGAVVGFIPGIAISYPLTATQWMADMPGYQGHYLEIPWLLILGLVVVLPLLTAAVVGLAARSRLPLVARLD